MIRIAPRLSIRLAPGVTVGATMWRSAPRQTVGRPTTQTARRPTPYRSPRPGRYLPPAPRVFSQVPPTPLNTPRTAATEPTTQRPTWARDGSDVQGTRRVGVDYRQALAAYTAQHSTTQPAYGPAPTMRPVRQPSTTVPPLVAIVGILVGGFIALMVLGMVGMALHITPATTPSVATPTHTASAQHVPTHTTHTTGGTAVRR